MEKTKLSIYQTKSPQETEAEMEEMHHLTLEQLVMHQTKMLHFLGLRSVLSSFFFKIIISMQLLFNENK